LTCSSESSGALVSGSDLICSGSSSGSCFAFRGCSVGLSFGFLRVFDDGEWGVGGGVNISIISL
jgi:hypothetical protein